MSAEIISLETWRREHRAHHEPENRCENRPANRPVSVPVLLPTWPCGWLQPMLVEVDVGMIAEFSVLAARFADQTGFGGLFYPAPPPRPDQHHRQSAAIHRLLRAPAAKGV